MSTHHVTKSEAKKPDFVTSELKKGFQWTTQHTKSVTTAVLIAIVGGVSLAAYTEVKKSKETKAQENYFKLEKEIVKKKTDFEKAANAQTAKINEAKNDTKDKKKKDSKPTTESAANLPMASGDLDKDYGVLVKDMSQFISNNISSKAAKMGALTLADIYLKYKRPEMALEILKKLPIEHDILSAMTVSQLGSVQADMKDCKSAISTWDQVLKSHAMQFMHSEVRLKQGLCYEMINDKINAEASYNKVIADAKEGQLGKTAEKYLRLLKKAE